MPRLFLAWVVLTLAIAAPAHAITPTDAVTRIELRDHDEQGFWERNGYHDRGDPWLEQRYQGD